MNKKEELVKLYLNRSFKLEALAHEAPTARRNAIYLNLARREREKATKVNECRSKSLIDKLYKDDII